MKDPIAKAVELMTYINDQYFAWKEASKYRNDPWAAYQAGYLQALNDQKDKSCQ